MKIYLTNEEQTYLHNMILSTVQQLEQTVNAYNKLKQIVDKTLPPRNYMDLNQDEKANIFGVLTTGVKAVGDLLNNLKEGTPEERVDHLKKVHSMLTGIRAKLLDKEPGDDAVKI